MTAEVVKRDRWGRYRIPHPETGAEQSWTRATTFAKSVSDTYNLGKWQARMVAKGITLRPDLFALASSAAVEDRSTLDEVASAAMEAAGSSTGRNQGSALHAFTERLDRGEVFDIPAPWDADVEAYRLKMRSAGLTVVPEYIERVVVNPEFGVAGTFDRLLRNAAGYLVVGDLKTAKDVSYGWLEIAVQLALYATATHLWDPVLESFEEMPAVHLDEAVVMHLPVGAARCDLYAVDIAKGYEVAQLCAEVRDWRSRSKKLASRYEPPAAPVLNALPKVDRFLTYTPPLAITEDLLVDAIGVATTVAELELLWSRNSERWTDCCTRAARKRKAELSNPPF